MSGAIIHWAGHLALVLVASPLLFGIISRTKARVAGRTGPPLFQPYFDLIKLFRKGAVYSRTTTGVFRAGPVVAFAAILSSALIVPFHGGRAPLSFQGDLVLFAYFLGLARFFMIVAALDTGSAFEGMGASREASFSCLAEPAVFLSFIALARASGSFSMSEFLSVGLIQAWPSAAGPALVLVVASFVLVLLAENARIPVDDPATHLELTMIHEVMVLDHSGPDFGFLQYAAAAKLLVFGAILVHIVHPVRSAGFLPFLAAMGLGLALVAILIGLIESSMARLRLARVPQYLVAANVLSGFAVLLTLAPHS